MKQEHPGIRMKLYNRDRKRPREPIAGGDAEGGEGDAHRDGACSAEVQGAEWEVAASEGLRRDDRHNSEEDLDGQHGADQAEVRLD